MIYPVKGKVIIFFKIIKIFTFQVITLVQKIKNYYNLLLTNFLYSIYHRHL
jgi:hypothetical protein